MPTLYTSVTCGKSRPRVLAVVVTRTDVWLARNISITRSDDRAPSGSPPSSLEQPRMFSLACSRLDFLVLRKLLASHPLQPPSRPSALAARRHAQRRHWTSVERMRLQRMRDLQREAAAAARSRGSPAFVKLVEVPRGLHRPKIALALAPCNSCPAVSDEERRARVLGSQARHLVRAARWLDAVFCEHTCRLDQRHPGSCKND